MELEFPKRSKECVNNANRVVKSLSPCWVLVHFTALSAYLISVMCRALDATEAFQNTASIFAKIQSSLEKSMV